MPIRVVRNRDLVRTAWKNGGGTTAEVAVHPSGAGFETFDWRLSMADVAADGPFSAFPGIDRTLVLIEGAGIDLMQDGVLHRLDPANPILSFPGEAATTGLLPGGPIRDFNVMTRRGRVHHGVSIASAGPQVGATALLVLAGPTELHCEGCVLLLDRFDTALIDERSGAVVTDRSMLSIRLVERRND